MSWGLSVVSKPDEIRANVNQYLAEAEEKGPSFSDQYQSVEVGHQIESAIRSANEMAATVLPSYAISTGMVRVRMSGHANSEHKPVSGWSNDYVVVEVTQL